VGGGGGGGGKFRKLDGIQKKHPHTPKTKTHIKSPEGHELGAATSLEKRFLTVLLADPPPPPPPPRLGSRQPRTALKRRAHPAKCVRALARKYGREETCSKQRRKRFGEDSGRYWDLQHLQLGAQEKRVARCAKGKLASVSGPPGGRDSVCILWDPKDPCGA